jgi:hypothetical protein
VTGFITFVPTDGAGHIVTPQQGSYVRESDGAPADLLADADYPVTAVCARCDGPIRLAFKLQMEWWHMPAVAAAASGAP